VPGCVGRETESFLVGLELDTYLAQDPEDERPFLRRDIGFRSRPGELPSRVFAAEVAVSAKRVAESESLPPDVAARLGEMEVVPALGEAMSLRTVRAVLVPKPG